MPLKDLFLLDPSITFLNFGSFGASPKPILEEYQRWQLELERSPVQFLTVQGPKLLEQSRNALAKYVGCSGEDLVYFPNPSHAVNMIAKSFGLQTGDEVLTTNLEYGACDKTWNFYCKKAGATYVRQPVSLPITTKEKFLEEFFAGITARTRLIFISHITSSTALILPVKEICAKAKEKGIPVFVDGAHAPAHVPLNISELGADIYTGACHKWMMTAKGSSFIYVNKKLQDQFDPLVVSWGYDSPFTSGSKFLDYHQLQGTRDISPFLTIPFAIQFMELNNWWKVAEDCRRLVRENIKSFCEILDTEPLAPLNDSYFGQMASAQIKTDNPEALQRKLFEDYRIEIPVMRHDQKIFIRYSINAFNSQEDLDKLFDALKKLKSQYHIH